NAIADSEDLTNTEKQSALKTKQESLDKNDEDYEAKSKSVKNLQRNVNDKIVDDTLVQSNKPGNLIFGESDDKSKDQGLILGNLTESQAEAFTEVFVERPLDPDASQDERKEAFDAMVKKLKTNNSPLVNKLKGTMKFLKSMTDEANIVSTGKEGKGKHQSEVLADIFSDKEIKGKNFTGLGKSLKDYFHAAFTNDKAGMQESINNITQFKAHQTAEIKRVKENKSGHPAGNVANLVKTIEGTIKNANKILKLQQAIASEKPNFVIPKEDLTPTEASGLIFGTTTGKKDEGLVITADESNVTEEAPKQPSEPVKASTSVDTTIETKEEPKTPVKGDFASTSQDIINFDSNRKAIRIGDMVKASVNGKSEVEVVGVTDNNKIIVNKVNSTEPRKNGVSSISLTVTQPYTKEESSVENVNALDIALQNYGAAYDVFAKVMAKSLVKNGTKVPTNSKDPLTNEYDNASDALDAANKALTEAGFREKYTSLQFKNKAKKEAIRAYRNSINKSQPKKEEVTVPTAQEKELTTVKEVLDKYSTYDMDRIANSDLPSGEEESLQNLENTPDVIINKVLNSGSLNEFLILAKDVENGNITEDSFDPDDGDLETQFNDWWENSSKPNYIRIYNENMGDSQKAKDTTVEQKESVKEPILDIFEDTPTVDTTVVTEEAEQPKKASPAVNKKTSNAAVKEQVKTVQKEVAESTTTENVEDNLSDEELSTDALKENKRILKETGKRKEALPEIINKTWAKETREKGNPLFTALFGKATPNENSAREKAANKDISNNHDVLIGYFNLEKEPNQELADAVTADLISNANEIANDPNNNANDIHNKVMESSKEIFEDYYPLTNDTHTTRLINSLLGKKSHSKQLTEWQEKNNKQILNDIKESSIAKVKEKIQLLYDSVKNASDYLLIRNPKAKSIFQTLPDLLGRTLGSFYGGTGNKATNKDFANIGLTPEHKKVIEHIHAFNIGSWKSVRPGDELRDNSLTEAIQNSIINLANASQLDIINDPFLTLLKDDGTIPQNLLDSMLITAFSYTYGRGSETLFNSESDVKRMLGKDSKDKLDPMVNSIFRNVGTAATTLEQQLGMEALRNMGMTIDKNSPEYYPEKMAQSIGQRILMGMVKQGYFELIPVDNTVIALSKAETQEEKDNVKYS
ncbi:MAG: hypothetical protein DRO67_08680, partial [Candidatus Asgardarchaeum californiense]